ncbi:MAG: metallophosphoesterase family protein, partial [candidate division WOR-3 bacterium]
MRLGIFSDVHANLEALQAVLKALRAEGVNHFICCGDVVGYGPDPNACVQVLRELRCPTVAGNHEYGLLGKTPLDHFNRTARDAVLWTRAQLRTDERIFLDELPLSDNLEPLLVVHAAPSNPTAWGYIFTVSEAEEEMREFSSAICVIGHTHYPFVVEKPPQQSG